MAGSTGLHKLAELGVHPAVASDEVRKQPRSSTAARGSLGSPPNQGQVHNTAPVSLENCILIFGDVPTELALALRPRDVAPLPSPKRARRQQAKPRISKKQNADKELAESVEHLLEEFGDSVPHSRDTTDAPKGSPGTEAKADTEVGKESEWHCEDCGQSWDDGDKPACTCAGDDHHVNSPVKPKSVRDKESA